MRHQRTGENKKGLGGLGHAARFTELDAAAEAAGGQAVRFAGQGRGNACPELSVWLDMYSTYKYKSSSEMPYARVRKKLPGEGGNCNDWL